MPPSPPARQVTQLLIRWREGDAAALAELMPLVHAELHRLAAHYMRGERRGHTLQTSALVNEAYLRLADHEEMQWQDRAHFFGVAAQAMRRILVDHARRKKAARHGGGATPVPLEEAWDLPMKTDVDLIALDEALDELASFAPRQAETVQLSYFGGLTFDEIALALEVSPVTVKRDLKAAKVWLLKEMEGR